MSKNKNNTNPSSGNNQGASYEVNSFYNNETNALTGADISMFYFGVNILDAYTPETLMSLVKNPMTNNKLLRELSLRLYGTNGVFRNAVDYTVALPTLASVVVVKDYSGKKNTKPRIDSKKANNKLKTEAVLKDVRHKEIARDSLLKDMVEGVSFYYYETNKQKPVNDKFMTDYDINDMVEISQQFESNTSIMVLPTNYTRIVGTRNSSYVLAFNLEYFLEFSSKTQEKKLRQFPKEIRDAFNKRKVAKRGKTDYGNWLVLDCDHTIATKAGSKREEPWGRPIVLAAIEDILYGTYFTQTKRNILNEMNNKIVYQTFPEGKEKGTSGLTQKQQKEQHEAVKSAILKKNNRGGTSVFSVAAGTKINTIDFANSDMFDSKYEADLNDRIALALGFAASALNGVGSGSYSAQQTNLELVSAQVFQWLEQFTNELNKCIAANTVKDKKYPTEVCYLPITYISGSKVVENAKNLYLQGKGSLIYWISACGIDPDAYLALMDYELENDFENLYPVHQTSYTQSSKDNTGGRPSTDDPSDNTVKSRANDGNNLPSPSDNE